MWCDDFDDPDPTMQLSLRFRGTFLEGGAPRSTAIARAGFGAGRIFELVANATSFEFDGPGNSVAAVPVKPFDGQWHDVHVTASPATGDFTLTIDGKPGTGSASPAPGPFTPKLVVGLYFLQPPASATSLRFDDVVFDYR